MANNQKINYQQLLDKLIEGLDHRPSLLLHACCAPCSSYCIEYLKKYFDITLFFYNPNITDKDEFDKRYSELVRLVSLTAPEINIVCPDYNPDEFYAFVKGKENCPEGGERCGICYALRLKKAFDYALENHFEYYCSTLSISPHKDADRLNSIGNAIAHGSSVKYLPNDFKKKGGYLRSIEICREYDIYRQTYCGCRLGERV